MNKGAYRHRCAWLMLALGASLAASASAETLEERLRTQLSAPRNSCRHCRASKPRPAPPGRRPSSSATRLKARYAN